MLYIIKKFKCGRWTRKNGSKVELAICNAQNI